MRNFCLFVLLLACFCLIGYVVERREAEVIQLEEENNQLRREINADLEEYLRLLTELRALYDRADKLLGGPVAQPTQPLTRKPE